MTSSPSAQSWLPCVYVTDQSIGKVWLPVTADMWPPHEPCYSGHVTPSWASPALPPSSLTSCSSFLPSVFSMFLVCKHFVNCVFKGAQEIMCILLLYYIILSITITKMSPYYTHTRTHTHTHAHTHTHTHTQADRYFWTQLSTFYSSHQDVSDGKRRNISLCVQACLKLMHGVKQ